MKRHKVLFMIELKKLKQKKKKKKERKKERKSCQII